MSVGSCGSVCVVILSAGLCGSRVVVDSVSSDGFGGMPASYLWSGASGCFGGFLSDGFRVF